MFEGFHLYEGFLQKTAKYAYWQRSEIHTATEIHTAKESFMSIAFGKPWRGVAGLPAHVAVLWLVRVRSRQQERLDPQQQGWEACVKVAGSAQKGETPSPDLLDEEFRT